ncbi:MAG TPA: type II secretion system F family protein [Gaiellaceae bacterium]
MQDRILRAGYAGKLSAEAFIAIQILAGLAGVALGAWLGNGTGAVLLAIVFGALGLYLPHFALSRAGRNRTTQIEQQLPHFVDQLAIAVEAGMSLDGALSYLLKLTKGPLADEMNLMMGELRVGEARRIALRHMVDRTGSEDVGLLVNAIINSDQRGVPLGGILRAQASDLRHRRQTSAEERAQKAPVKMLFPIVIFILPVMFVVIIGPALINIHNYL